MFTGIIEEIGTVVSMSSVPDLVLWDGTVGAGQVLEIECTLALTDAYVGCSVAMNGTCLTVTSISENSLSFGCSPETLRRTNLNDLKAGSPVNIERSAGLSARNSGHFVQGHVDTTGTVRSMRREGDSLWVEISLPDSDEMLRKYIVPKGYVALDGTSLTVCQVNLTQGWFSVMLVEYTQRHIILPRKSIGERVNIEVDVMGKYVEKSMDWMVQRLLVMEQQQEWIVRSTIALAIGLPVVGLFLLKFCGSRSM